MKKLLFILLLLCVMIGLGYQNKTVLTKELYTVTYFSSCDTPIRYKIGTIDPKFNISQQDFLQAIAKAGNIWSTTENKQLFVYDPQGDVTISLQYDQRQALNTQINQMNTQLDQQDKQLQPEIQAYEQRVKTFKQDTAALNQEIESWNAKGGAPQDVYNSLLAKQHQLQQEAQDLRATAGKLGQSTDDYNNEVQQLGQTVDTYNQALKYKPEEGVYIQDQQGRRIIIYFYNTDTELVHTLAHEMGHSLGLNHVSDPNAIMYFQTNNAITPASADKAELDDICRKKSIIELAQNRLATVIAFYKQALHL